MLTRWQQVPVFVWGLTQFAEARWQVTLPRPTSFPFSWHARCKRMDQNFWPAHFAETSPPREVLENETLGHICFFVDGSSCLRNVDVCPFSALGSG